MEILKNLELVEVGIEDEKATLTFLDEENGEIREVTFNKRDYDKSAGKFVESEEKAAKVEEWCQEYFGCAFKDLKNCVGVRKDVYAYDKFSSLWESDTKTYDKFPDEMVGELFQTTIKDVEEDTYAIRIHYDYEGKCYESKMTHGKWLEQKKAWYEDPIKKEKVYKKFNKKFGVDVCDKDKLVGADIIVEVKKAFGTHTYGDIKPMPSKKK